MSRCIECDRLIDGDYQEIHNDCYETLQIQLSKAKAENVRLLKGQCHPACEAKLNDLKAENARLKEDIRDLMCENGKLNVILFHKENHFAHPDNDITIGLLESEIADLKRQVDPAADRKEG